MPGWWNGRHVGLKIQWPDNGCAGSSPAPGTKSSLIINDLGGFVVLKSDLPPKVPPKCGIGKMIRSMAEGVRYIEPKIVSAKRGWFIALKYEYPDQVGKYKRFEISAGVNYIQNLQEREKEIQKLLVEVRRALQAGFDPFHTNLEKEFVESISEKIEAIKKAEEASQGWTITEGTKQVQDYCQKKNLSHNTTRTYDSFINNLTFWLEETEQTEVIASTFDEERLFEFLDQRFDEEGWSPRTYNNHLKFSIHCSRGWKNLKKSRIKT